MVNVYTEWGPLDEVIVGDCLNFSSNFNDLSFQMVYYENLKNQQFVKSDRYRHDVKRIKERQHDLNYLADYLTRMGITVRRPEPLRKAERIATPDWSSIMTAPDQPRDTFMCVGKTIIETPPTVRGRYYESSHYHKIFRDYHKEGASWIAAPRPSLKDSSMDLKSLKDYKRYNLKEDMNPNFEMMFDAANCIKLGKDIMMNIGSKNAELGFKWLQNILPEFNIVPVYLTDDHIDGAIMPLRPGVFLYNPKLFTEQSLRDKLPFPYYKWDLLPTQDEDLGEDYTEEEVMIASEQCMALNVLSIDEGRLMIPSDAHRTIDMLSRQGFDAIPIPFRHTRLFSGGIHCCTTDVRRNDFKYFL